jgi:hypothetical protein
VSLPDHPSKRRKTFADASPHKSSSIGSPRKDRVTYGKRSKTIVASLSGTIFANGSSAHAAHDDANPANEKGWELPGTIHANWIQHEPNGLFPDPSSTIPNATMTQQRVLERVNALALLGAESDVDVPPYEPPAEPSIPWSDLLRFTPTGTGEQSDPHEPQAEAEPVAHSPYLSEQAQKSLSQRSRLSSSVRLGGSPFGTEVLLDNVDPKAVMPPPQATISSQDMGLTPTGPNHSQSRTQQGVQNHSQQKSKMSSLPNSEDDLAAIGLPKEQYVPRPSRSRSLKVDIQEPADFSVRPEKVCKTTRRRKTDTTNMVPSSDAPGTSQKLHQLLDMGFTPKSSEQALRENNNDVDRSVDWLVANGMVEDELARDTPKITSATKVVDTQKPDATGSTNARPLTETTTTVDEPVALETPAKPDSVRNMSSTLDLAAPSKPTHLKSPKVQVVIPSKSPQKPEQPIPTGKKPKRRKTTLDVPEPDSTLEPLAVSSAIVEKKKKGRGRPKKAANVDVAIEGTPQMPQEEAEDHGKMLQPLEEKTMMLDSKSARDAEAVVINTLERSDHTSGTAQDSPPENTAAPKEPSLTKTSRTPEPSLKKTTESPASTGKVSYRVGLSKRARIAPLLRIRKK